MYCDCVLQLSKNTILREVMGKIYINEMKKHSLMLLTLEAKPILEYVRVRRRYEDIKKFIEEYYEMNEDDDEFCKEFVGSLIELGFLEIQSDEYRLEDVNDNKHSFDFGNKVALEEEAIENKYLLSVTIELTYKCNLHCKHCFVGDTESQILNKEFYFALIDDLYKIGTLNIVFTGGEIFSRKDSFDIIKYAVDKNFVVDVFTNGTLIDELLFEKLSCLNIHSIQSSIYSVKEDVHDEFVGKIGAFQATLTNLKKFAEVGIMTAIKTCIFDFNYNEFEKIKKLAESINATFQYTMTLLPKKNGENTPMKFGMSRENMQEFINKVEESYYYEKEDEQAICSAGQTSLSINPEGVVYMCNAFDWPIGDLRKTSISEIWLYSKELNEWRNATMIKRVDCYKCKYANYCDYCPGSAYKLTGSPYLKYEEACEQARMIYGIKDI